MNDPLTRLRGAVTDWKTAPSVGTLGAVKAAVVEAPAGWAAVCQDYARQSLAEDEYGVLFRPHSEWEPGWLCWVTVAQQRMLYLEPSRKGDLFADFCPTPGKDDLGKAIAVLLGFDGEYRHIPDSYMTTDMYNPSTPTWITPRNVEYPQGIAIVTTSLVVGMFQRPGKDTPISVDAERRILAAVLDANRRTRGWVAHVMLGRDLEYATKTSSLLYQRVAEHVGYPKTLVEWEQAL